jgi:predicted O-linked N-acetylglucosamine transferase (SPINDLY family)
MAVMTVDEALGLARSHIQTGRMAEGEAVCRAILQGAPEEAEAHRLLGLLACTSGNPALAEAHVRKALECRPQFAEAHLALCMVFAAQGRYPEAEEEARRTLEIRPQFAEAQNNLGGALQGQGRLDEAVVAFRRALELRPEFAQAAYNLGFVLQTQEKWDEAAEAYEAALRLQPGRAEAENNLGFVRHKQGRMKEAVEAYRRSLVAQPGNARAAYNLGLSLQALGCIDEAIDAYRIAIAGQPDLHDAANNLGSALYDRGHIEEAIQAYQHALTVQPAFAEAENNLGNALKAQGKVNEAIAAFRRALDLRPEYPEAASNLGLAFHATGRLEEAAEAYRKALAARAEFAEAENNLGNALLAQGDHEAARSAYNRALALRPSYTAAHSNLLMCEQYQPGATLAGLARAHAEWDERHATAHRELWQPWDLDRTSERPLRLGFVSPDLRRHPVGAFLLRVLENLDRRGFEAVCYYSRAERDDYTERLVAASKEWHDVLGMPNDALAAKIREDRIDILFDLSGHTGDHRLQLFARRPAPIQITWLGYVGTTGLAAIDYLIADRFHVPPGAEEHYREKVLRMPDGYACFEPPDEAPEVGPLPALERGQVTFGSFNNVSKLHRDVVALWAEVVRRVSGSRLVLVSPALIGRTARRRVGEAFVAAGGLEEQLELRGTMLRPKLLAAYNEIDIALDPFPYSGGITTCEALWMGVPVITCPGETFASRHSFSHLSNIGMTETVAADTRDYVERAAGLAADLPYLATLRAGLRDRMARSPLCDGPRFAGHLATLLRDVWKEWCRAQDA